MTKTLLISPHQFENLDREQRLANEFGLTLLVAQNQEEFEIYAKESEIVMITPYGRLTADLIASMPNCQGIVRYGIGYDNIDATAASAVGIPVTIVPDASTEEVATHAFALGVALSRRIPLGQAAIEQGSWAAQVPGDLPTLSALEVGVVGMGRIGRRVANLWQSVGARVHAYDPIATFTEVPEMNLDVLLMRSDLISLHLPLTEQTRHMISREVINRMRPKSIVINVSRGGLVDEDALAEALHSGQLAGAGLDVYESEPLPLESALRQAPNTMLTPHTAWKSRTSLDALQAGAVDRARAILTGDEVPDRVA